MADTKKTPAGEDQLTIRKGERAAQFEIMLSGDVTTQKVQPVRVFKKVKKDESGESTYSGYEIRFQTSKVRTWVTDVQAIKDGVATENKNGDVTWTATKAGLQVNPEGRGFTLKAA